MVTWFIVNSSTLEAEILILNARAKYFIYMNLFDINIAYLGFN